MRRPTDWGLRWRRKLHKTLSQEIRPITFTVNDQDKEAEERTLIKILWQSTEGKRSANYIHNSTKLHIDLMSCMLVTRIRQLPLKPFCLPTHSYLHQPPPQNVHSFPPPTNHPTCNHKITTQRPINHRVQSISRFLQHPPLHRPNVTPPKPKFCSQKACRLIKTSHNCQTSMKSHTQSS